MRGERCLLSMYLLSNRVLNVEVISTLQSNMAFTFKDLMGNLSSCKYCNVPHLLNMSKINKIYVNWSNIGSPFGMASEPGNNLAL